MTEVEIVNGETKKIKLCNYYEIKMVNGDVFKTIEPPDKWMHRRMSDGNSFGWVLDTIRITDIRSDGPVFLNSNLISSIRYVDGGDDLEDERYEKLRDETNKLTADVLGATLGALFGGPKEVQ